MIRTLIFTAAIAGTWQFETERDPLGNPVYVAQVTPDSARPDIALKFSCGGVVGVVLQFNLGDIEYSGSQFSTDEPAPEGFRFQFPEGPYDTLAKRAPIADGLSTYEIKGSEAAFIAGLMQDSDSVSIKRESVSFTFPLSGAQAAIAEVTDACPFKYKN